MNKTFCFLSSLRTIVIFFMTIFCLQNAFANTTNSQDADVLFSQDLDPDLIDENNRLSAYESIKDVVKIAKERQDESDVDNLSPRDFLLRSKAKSAAVNAILHRNYKEPEDEILKEEKKLFNADMARMNGSAILSGKNKANSGFSASTMLEAGLSSSFDKKNRKKKNQNNSNANSSEPIFLKYYRAEVNKRRQEKAEKKGDGNSAQYRNQAGSFSDAFKTK